MGSEISTNRDNSNGCYNRITELINSVNLLCFIKSVSKYSNKKIHSYLVLILIFYLGIYTDKFDFFVALLPVYSALLGLREYAKNQYHKHNNKK